MQNNNNLDKMNIEQSLDIIINTKNDQERTQADLYLREQEKKNPNMIICLIEIYKNSISSIKQLQCLLLIKNLIIRNWNRAEIINGKRTNVVSEKVKEEVKSQIITLLIQQTDKKLQDEIRLIISKIAKTDFPNKFQRLYEYFIIGLNQSFTLNTQSILDYLCLMKTLKCILKELVFLPLNSQANDLKIFFTKISIPFCLLWNQIYQTLISLLDKNEINEFHLCLSSDSDRIISYIFKRYQQNELAQEMLQKMLLKLQFLVNINQHQCNSNMKTLLHSLTIIQFIQPLSFQNNFQIYLNILFHVLQNYQQQKNIITIAFLGILKILKTPTYYFSEKQYKESIMFQQNLQSVQKQCQEIFQNFFESKLSLFIEFILQNMEITQLQNPEEISTQEEEVIQCNYQNETHIPQHIICLNCYQELVNRFPQQIYSFIDLKHKELLNIQYQGISLVLLGNFFVLLGSTQQATEILKIEPIQIFPTLQLLINQQNTWSYQAFVNLIRMNMKYFTQNQKPQVAQLLMQLLLISNDKTIFYFCLVTIKKILEDYEYIDESISQLILQLQPLIIEAIFNCAQPGTCKILIKLLQKLICLIIQNGKNIQEKNTQLLLYSQLEILMKTNVIVIIEGLCDIFKQIFVMFPLGQQLPQLFKLCILLINNNFQTKLVQIIDLYLFLLQEYDTSLDCGEIGKQLQLIFYQNEESFLQCENNKLSVKIVEELIILNLLPITSQLQYQIIKWIMISNQQEILQASIIRKEIYNLIDTILELKFDFFQKEIQKEILLNLLVSFLQETSNRYGENFVERQFYQLKEQKNIQIIVISKFILYDVNAIVSFFELTYQDINLYFMKWINQSENLKNRGQCKINVTALLLCLTKISTQVFIETFSQLMKICISEIDYEELLKDQQFKQQQQVNLLKRLNSENSRINEDRISFRKYTLKINPLYKEDFTIKQFFFQYIKDALQYHNINNVASLIRDQEILEKLTSYQEC